MLDIALYSARGMSNIYQPSLVYISRIKDTCLLRTSNERKTGHIVAVLFLTFTKGRGMARIRVSPAMIIAAARLERPRRREPTILARRYALPLLPVILFPAQPIIASQVLESMAVLIAVACRVFPSPRLTQSIIASEAPSDWGSALRSICAFRALFGIRTPSRPKSDHQNISSMPIKTLTLMHH